MSLGFIFPGQGSQQPGMGRDVALASDAARSVFDAADAALGFSLSKTCFEGPEEELFPSRAVSAEGSASEAAARY